MSVAITSDRHWTVDDFESRSLFPEHTDKELYERLRHSIELANNSVNNDLRIRKPQHIIDLGDFTGGYREQGLRHPKAADLASKKKAEIEAIAPFHVALGNHDFGYSGAEKEGGISTQSVENAKAIFGPLYWSFEHEGTLIIGICSPLIGYKGAEPIILRESKNQLDFIQSLPTIQPALFVLSTHDPLVMRKLSSLLDRFLNKVGAVLTGDLHSVEAVERLKKLRIPNLMEKFGTTEMRTLGRILSKAVPCPAVAPLWSRGYSYVWLSFSPIDYEIVKLPVLQLVPTQSFWRCLWWMSKAYMPRIG